MGNGTSIGRVRGLGSAHSGAHHWLVQRLTAIGNVVLGVWLVASLMLLPSLNYLTVHDWLVRPLPACAMGLLLVCGLWHARLGVQVLIEDYVHVIGNRFACLVLLNLASAAALAFGLICVARIVLGAA